MIMKKFKGQALTTMHYIVIIAFTTAVCLAAIFMMGGNFGGLVQKNQSKILTKNPTIHFELPTDLMTQGDYILEVPGREGGKMPIENILSQNIDNGEYIQTSGSSGRMQEIILKEYPFIMADYVNMMEEPIAEIKNTYGYDFDAVEDILGGWFGVSVFEMPAFIAGDDFLKKSWIIFYLILGFHPDATVSPTTTMCAVAGPPVQPCYPYFIDKYNDFVANAPASPEKDFVVMAMNDLLNFFTALQYNVDESLYTEILGEAKANTLEQDYRLFYKIGDDEGSYTQEQREAYNKKISVTLTKNYHQLAPNTYNNQIHCTSGGPFCVYIPPPVMAP